MRKLMILATALVALTLALPAQQYVVMPSPVQQFVDADGVPYSGGLLYIYEAGTTDFASIFTDDGGTESVNPVVLDSAGRATVYLQVGEVYRFVLHDESDLLVWTQDNVNASGGGGGAGGNTVGTLTVTGTGDASIQTSGGIQVDGRQVIGRSGQLNIASTEIANIAGNLDVADGIQAGTGNVDIVDSAGDLLIPDGIVDLDALAAAVENRLVPTAGPDNYVLTVDGSTFGWEAVAGIGTITGITTGANSGLIGGCTFGTCVISTSLDAGDIPTLPASKIGSGIFLPARLAAGGSTGNFLTRTASGQEWSAFSLPNASVLTTHLGSDAVTQPKVANDAIGPNEVNASGTPEDGDLLRYDSDTGGFTWQPIGFDTADWSGVAGTTSICPTTAGGAMSNGPEAGIANLISQDSIRLMTVLATTAKPFLNYDVTMRNFPSEAKIYQFDSTGARMLLATVSAENDSRVTGKTASLATGLYSILISVDFSDTTFCPKISSIWTTAT